VQLRVEGRPTGCRSGKHVPRAHARASSNVLLDAAAPYDFICELRSEACVGSDDSWLARSLSCAWFGCAAPQVTDWLPTVMGLASRGSWAPEPGRVLDGYDQWAAMISGGAVPSPRSSALISYFASPQSNAANRGAAVRWNTEVHEYKLIALAVSRAWFSPPTTSAGGGVRLSNASAAATAAATHQPREKWGGRGRMLMGGGGNDGANCTGGGGQNNRCWWLFDLAVDDDERNNIYEVQLIASTPF
jgi:hypothetical protein